MSLGITLPDVPITGAIIETAWGIDVRNALSELDAALPGPLLAGEQATEGSVTNSTGTIVTVAGLSIPSSERFEVWIPYRRTSGAAAASTLGVQVNSQKLFGTDGRTLSTANNAPGQGLAIFRYGSRAGSYPRSCMMTWAYGESADGLTGVEACEESSISTSTITSVVIYGNSGDAAITLSVDEVAVYVWP